LATKNKVKKGKTDPIKIPANNENLI
jgi:hypothetical protein